MNICIAIPVHNEAERIGGIVGAIKARNLDVIVIDDGSSDNSGALARENGAFVIKNECKKGKGFSLQRAFEYALRQNYDGVITMDGDGQHDVGDIDHFMEQIAVKPNRIITGTRMGNPRTMPLIRLLTNRFMSFLISSLCKQSIPDTQCGYRYISRDILKGLRLTARDFEIETEVLSQASRQGYEIASIPIKTIYRNEKSKINPLRDTFRFFVYLIKEMRQGPS